MALVRSENKISSEKTEVRQNAIMDAFFGGDTTRTIRPTKTIVATPEASCGGCLPPAPPRMFGDEYGGVYRCIRSFAVFGTAAITAACVIGDTADSRPAAT